MYVEYELKNGKIIRMFTYDLLESEYENKSDYWRGSIEGWELDENGEQGKEFKVDIIKDNEKKAFYFEYDNERVYIKDFKKMTLENLIEKLNNKEYMYENDIVLTLMENADDFAILAPLRVPDAIIPGLFCSYSDNSEIVNALCVPYTEDRGKGNWSYKIDIIPVDEYERFALGLETYYTSTFVDYLRKGEIKLLDKKEAIKNYKSELDLSKEDKEFIRKLTR